MAAAGAAPFLLGHHHTDGTVAHHHGSLGGDPDDPHHDPRGIFILLSAHTLDENPLAASNAPSISAVLVSKAPVLPEPAITQRRLFRPPPLDGPDPRMRQHQTDVLLI